jgi:hypothetical protein
VVTLGNFSIVIIHTKKYRPNPNMHALEIVDDGDETAFTCGCIFSARLRSDFASDEVDASNAAFQCRRGRMEMQQVGVDPNDLRAQPRGSLYLDELTSSA